MYCIYIATLVIFSPLPPYRCTWISVLPETAVSASHSIVQVCREPRLRGWAPWAAPQHPPSRCCWPTTRSFWNTRLAKDPLTHSLTPSDPTNSFFSFLGRPWGSLLLPKQPLQYNTSHCCRYIQMIALHLERVQIHMNFSSLVLSACFFWRVITPQIGFFSPRYKKTQNKNTN